MLCGAHTGVGGAITMRLPTGICYIYIYVYYVTCMLCGLSAVLGGAIGVCLSEGGKCSFGCFWR
jgi:hypothetical protein